MILKYDYLHRLATIRGYSGETWTVPLSITHIKVDEKEYFVDLGTLLLYRKVNPSMSEQDIMGALKYVKAWADFEEKQSLVDILEKALHDVKENNALIFEASVREAYGILHGCILSRGVHTGKLIKHKSIMTRAKVVDLVNFLLINCSYAASTTFPSPKSRASGVNAVRKHHKGAVKEANSMMKNMESFEIFTAWRLASYIEKIEQRNYTRNATKGPDVNRSIGARWHN